MHPRYGIEKTYLVRVEGKIDDDTLQKIRNGIHLSEGRTSGARILVFRRQRDSSWLSVTIHEGMNREIRRVFARVGFKVIELKRTRIGPVHDRGLKIGRWRPLSPQEVKLLLAGAPAEQVQEHERKSQRKRPPRSFSGKRGLAPGPRPVTSAPSGAPPAIGRSRGKAGFAKRGAAPFRPGGKPSAGPRAFRGGGARGPRSSGPARGRPTPLGRPHGPPRRGKPRGGGR
jgi:23S rRNA pseudouridine2605 synthase